MTDTHTTRNEITKGGEMPLAVKTLREDLGRMMDQFKYALPAHIPAERFIRVVMTAVQRNPKLLRCTRQSFFNACMSAANDGLLPDGREGAIVPFSEDEDGRGGKSDQAGWIPMVAGLRKKVRNAGILSDWNVQVVQEGDQFDYALGDTPYIHHKPAPTGGRARKVLFAYSIATFPDGTKSREVMNFDQIEDIRKKSKAKRGPWSDPTFYPEMARKTVARLHSKQLPQSTDLDRLLQRDDALYDFTGAGDKREAIAPAQRPSSVAAALDQFGGGAEDAPSPPKSSPANAPLGSLGTEPAPAQSEPPQQNSDASTAEQSADTSDPAAAAAEAAWERGMKAKADGHARKAIPGEYRGQDATALAAAWLKGWDGIPLSNAG